MPKLSKYELFIVLTALDNLADDERHDKSIVADARKLYDYIAAKAS